MGVWGAGEEAEWRLQHAQHVEKALLTQQATMDTIGQAVAAVSQDVQPGPVPDASFLVAAAEGVLFEGLASLLHQVSSLSAHTSSTTPPPPHPTPSIHSSLLPHPAQDRTLVCHLLCSLLYTRCCTSAVEVPASHICVTGDLGCARIAFCCFMQLQSLRHAFAVVGLTHAMSMHMITCYKRVQIHVGMGAVGAGKGKPATRVCAGSGLDP